MDCTKGTQKNARIKEARRRYEMEKGNTKREQREQRTLNTREHPVRREKKEFVAQGTPNLSIQKKCLPRCRNWKKCSPGP